MALTLTVIIVIVTQVRFRFKIIYRVLKLFRNILEKYLLIFVRINYKHN